VTGLASKGYVLPAHERSTRSTSTPEATVAEQRTTPVTIAEALTRATQCLEFAQDEDPGHRADHLLTMAEAWQSLAATIHDVNSDD
jgi:hypothetical protein